MATTSEPRSIFQRNGEHIRPTGLARGPWDANAQHGGAPAGLLAQRAIEALDDDSFELQRLTLELTRPVPLETLELKQTVQAGRSIARVFATLHCRGKAVSQAVALFGKTVPLELAREPDSTATLPPPAECRGDIFHIKGMDTEPETFHYHALESRLAAGSVAEAGPAAAWFRLRHCLFADTPTAPAARAMAIADMGNGISWALPMADYLFANADLTIHLHRPPENEWVGVDSRTQVEPTGLGCTYTVLHDPRGPIGTAQQSLLIRRREADA